MAGSADRHVEKSAGLLRELRQMIFQDPCGSLNPRMRVGESMGESLLVRRLARGAALRTRVGELPELVGLDAAHEAVEAGILRGTREHVSQCSSRLRQRPSAVSALGPRW
jgi:ABC-type glutathione transport system ATPase component